MKTLLHVGCGYSTIRDLAPFFHDGQWTEIRLDINPDVQPDIVAETRDMAILDDGAVDAVYSSHNIEHVSSFEVPAVLAEFRRVLRPTGFLAVLCPDIAQVAQAILDGGIEQPVYHSAAGPIGPIDILYGYQADLQQGNHYMAHKMAFTSDSLAAHVLRAGFVGAVVVRAKGAGLICLAFPEPADRDEALRMAQAVCIQPELLFAAGAYGRFRDG